LTTVQNLISSMPDRLKTVIKNKGDCSVLTFAHGLEVMLFVVALLHNFMGAATLLSIITVAE